MQLICHFSPTQSMPLSAFHLMKGLCNDKMAVYEKHIRFPVRHGSRKINPFACKQKLSQVNIVYDLKCQMSYIMSDVGNCTSKS